MVKYLVVKRGETRSIFQVTLSQELAVANFKSVHDKFRYERFYIHRSLLEMVTVKKDIFEERWRNWNSSLKENLKNWSQMNSQSGENLPVICTRDEFFRMLRVPASSIQHCHVTLFGIQTMTNCPYGRTICVIRQRQRINDNEVKVPYKTTTIRFTFKLATISAKSLGTLEALLRLFV